MLKSLMIGATALAAVAVAAPDLASARPGGGGGGRGGGANVGGGGGAHFGGGGGARFSGGGAAFRGAAVSPSFRSAGVPNAAFRSNAVGGNAARFAAAPNARFAANGAGGNWSGRHRGFRRGFGYGGLALGLAAAPYYYNNYGYPYDDTYYDNYAYGDGYYNQYGDNGAYVVNGDQDSSCYVQRRVHTLHGWRLRNVYVCG